MCKVVPLSMLAAFAVLAAAQDDSQAPVCRITVTQEPTKPAHNIGFLNGVRPSTPDSAIVRTKPYVVRLPSVAPPYWSVQAQRLRKLGVRTVQLILGPQIIEQRSALNNSALRAACWPATGLPATGGRRGPAAAGA